jgi:NAD(P)-dependent dehydrogenase (short-subunit alcohol dehydrogenase family)
VRGSYADPTASLVNASFGTKVTGPILLAKHFASKLAPDGSFLFMSGATALKPTPGMLTVAAAALMALTNGFLTGTSIPVDGGEHLV